MEVPNHGFAIDFPAEWLVGWMSQGPAFGGDLVLRAQSITEDGADCQIEDGWGLRGLSDVDSMDEWIEVLIGVVAARGRTTEPAVIQVDLPSGRNVRVDWRRWRGTPLTAWAFFDGDRRLLLHCRSDEPPADHWLSIAETFEFLPGSD